MNIIEAVKTGRQIRRRGEKHWGAFPLAGRYSLTKEDLEADDWEVEPIKIDVVVQSVKSFGDPSVSIPRIEFTFSTVNKAHPECYARLMEMFHSKKIFAVTL